MGKLEESYPDTLAVIGVHSAKYPAEQDPDNVRDAVQRLGMRHPVVNDPQHGIWDSYAVNAWPTLVFISPRGQVIGRHAGEAPFEALASVIDRLIEEYEQTERLIRAPAPAGQHVSRQLDSLAYPGKVLATATDIFVADSGHHRIICAGTDGQIRWIAGSGAEGLHDGDFAEATFARPQGMALDADVGLLFVADAGNHAVRALRLVRHKVETIAGTGEQATRAVRRGLASSTPLSSPWDLALSGAHLYIAMAGTHQIWQLHLESAMLSAWAGTGHEAIRDGPRESAWLAQPMGLCQDDRALFVSCAETQAVRRIDLASNIVSTLIGQGLFTFGDTDGPATQALLQHNQDVATSGATIYIADTYNNRIKSIDPATGTVTSPFGSGQKGELDGPGKNARFNEPAGLSALEGTLYVADTNNHRIRTVDLDTGHVRTLQFHGWMGSAEP